jgi:hypothetical protein
MKKQEHKQIISVDEFDETVSLYQLLPNSDGKSISHLKMIVNSILNNPAQQQIKPLSLLVVGPQATRTHGRAFIRALGIEEIRETHAQVLNTSYNAINDFFNPLLPTQSFLLSNIEVLYSSILKSLFEIITTGQYYWYDSIKKAKGIAAVYNPVVMTARDITKIPEYFQESIQHIVMLGEYSQQNLELVVLQRLKYAQIDFEEEVLKLTVEQGCNDLQNIITILKSSITVMLAGNRSVLTVGDVNKAKRFSLLRVGEPPDIPF